MWTGALFLGQFLGPLVIAGVAVPAGGLQPALTVLGVAATLAAVTTWRVLHAVDEPLDGSGGR